MNNHFFFQSSINSTHFSIVSLVFFFGSCFFWLAILVTEFGGSRITTFVDTRSGHHVIDKRIHICKLYFIDDASTVDSEWHINKNKCVHYIHETECNQLTFISENKVWNARSSYLATVRMQSKYCLISLYNCSYNKIS